MTGYRSHDIEVDGIPSTHLAYGEQGPHTVREIFNIVDDSEQIWKSVYTWVADFIVDEDYFLKTGFVRDKRTLEYYAMVTDESLSTWEQDTQGAAGNDYFDDKSVSMAGRNETGSGMEYSQQKV